MKELHLKRKTYDEADFKKRYAGDKDCSMVINEECKIFIDGKLCAVLLYDVPVEKKLIDCINGLDGWSIAARGSGIKTQTIAIGTQARSPAQSREHCATASIGHRHPGCHSNILTMADMGQRYYEQHLPDELKLHSDWTDKNILPEWRINKTVFTSGVINKNCSMAYHKDRGNTADGWSCMFVFKNHMSGGDLNVIDLDAKIFLPDRSVLFFDGKHYMHGVTKMLKTRSDGYRYSVVFYTLEAIKSCLTYKDEIKRAQKLRTEREMRRAGLLEKKF